MPARGSAHLAGLHSLLAVALGKLFALLLFLFSAPSPLSLSPKLSCWWSHRACPALALQQALPALSHCSDPHLGRVLPGHPAARQAVPRQGIPRQGVPTLGCPYAGCAPGRTHWALLAPS